MPVEPVEPVEERPEPSIAKEVQLFVQHIDALETSLPRAMLAITTQAREADSRFQAFAEKYGSVTKQHEHGATYTFSVPYDARAGLLAREAANAAAAGRLVPRVFVLALVGQFDAFLGRLLRALFLLRPELMAGSERTLTLAQLVDLGTVEKATEYLLDKEVESVLRKSHADQFTWMENKFQMKLREGLASWPCFIEVTERRNLFAHADGVVSDQYLSTCAAHGVEHLDDCGKGDCLSVTPEYFEAAHDCLFEVGVKLAQVLWRKLKPDQLEQAERSLIEVTFDLLVAGRYSLACVLLDFASTELKKHGTEQNRRILAVNHAQAYKWAGDADRCQALLDDEDWSACGLEFHLAVAVLEDQFDDAAEIMRRIGADGLMPETHYQEWPIFREFRKSPQFAEAYQEVFGKPFVHIESAIKADEKQRQQAALEHLREVLKDATIADDDEVSSS